jgi:hypothetical protein
LEKFWQAISIINFANSCPNTLFPGADNRPHEFLKQHSFALKHPKSQR